MTPTGLSRRLFVVIAAVAIFSILASGQITQTHGEAIGDPLPDRVTIWTRASAAASVSVLYSTSPGLAGLVESAPVLATAATDFAVKVEVTGLLPATTYYFRVRLVNPATSATAAIGVLGHFRTAPAASDTADLTALFLADVQTPALYGIFAAMQGEAAAFTLMMGDMPYADGAVTVSDYRAFHQAVRNEPTLQSFLRSGAIIANWDDHEVTNDWDAATSPTLVANGRATWKEWFPARLSTNDFYRSFRMGAGAEFFILDTRTYRGLNAAPDLPGRTLLGTQQLQWLKTALLASTATFKFIVSSVPLRYGTTNKDHWQGYMRERQDLLQWITSNRIANVIVLSGDQHWSAVHHHREGIKEIQACPAATSVRTPPAEPEPEVISIDAVRSYGVLRLHPSAVPPAVVIEIHDASGALLRSMTIPATTPGTIDVDFDNPDAAFTLDGPHHFRNDGAATHFDYAPAGTYALQVVPPAPQAPAAALALHLPPAGFLAASTNTHAPPSAAHPTLFRADFDTPDLSAWTFVDEGTTDAPSAWFQDDFELVQSSNIYGGSTAGTDPVKPGTFAAAGNTSWTDYTFTFRVKTQDDDGVGAMFRVAGNGTYYRFMMDKQRSYQRLTRTLNGVTTTLVENTNAYVADHWYDVTIKAIGSQLSVALDGQIVLSTTDAAIPAGRIALYSWGSQVVWFDRVVVRAGNVTGPSGALFWSDFSAPTLAGWTVVDQGTTAAPSAWAVSSGILNQTSNIYGGTLVGTDPHKPGTFLLNGSPTWSDVVLSARLRNTDNDGIGLMFRVVDANNYYRFAMDSERAYRRLTKTVNGVTTTLVEDGVAYPVGSWVDVSVRMAGPAITVFVGGAPILSATDATFAAGRIALYCWGSTGASFDDVTVMPLASPPVTLAAFGTGSQMTITAHAPALATRGYLFALSLANAPGIPLSILNPADARVIPLVDDAVLELSLQPLSIFSGMSGVLDASGDAQATVVVPGGVSLSGLTLYASGVVFDPGALSGIAEVLPSLRIHLP